MKVLVVDDDRLVARSLKTILDAEDDIEVTGALSDGAEAVMQYDRLSRRTAMDIRMKTRADSTRRSDSESA